MVKIYHIKDKMIKIFIPVFMFLFGAGYSVLAGEIIHKTFSVGSLKSIDMIIDHSEVSIIPSQTSEVRLRADVQPNSKAPTINLRDNTLFIESRNPSEGGNHVNFILYVPKGLKIKVTAGYLEIHSGTPVQECFLQAGTLTGDVVDPGTLKISAGTVSNLLVTYSRIPLQRTTIDAQVGSGGIRWVLPKESRLFVESTFPPGKGHLECDFPSTTQNPDFNFTLSSGKGIFEIRQDHKRS